MDEQAIRIRRAEVDDAAALHEIYSCPGAYGGTLQLPHPSVETWRRRLTEAGDGIFMLVAAAGDRVVGNLGIHTFTQIARRRHAGMIGMAVHDEWQGRGVGSALMGAAVDLADRWLNLTRLELEVFVDNERGIRLYERFGFEREGTLRNYAFRDGVYVDAYVMARLRS